MKYSSRWIYFAFFIICVSLLVLNVWLLKSTKSNEFQSNETNEHLYDELMKRYQQTKDELQSIHTNYEIVKSEYSKLLERMNAAKLEEAEKKKIQARKSKFKLEIKVLTFNRPNSLRRCLEKLSESYYDNDEVDLYVFIDHFSPGNDILLGDINATEVGLPYIMNKNEHDEKLKIQRNVLDLVVSFNWKHGRKYIHYRQRNAHLQTQWIESWYPLDNDTYAFFVEDDVILSPYWYQYLKKMILRYRYDENRDPLAVSYMNHIYGISLQKQDVIPGFQATKKRIRLNNGYQPFMYQLIGTWGQLFFPEAWRDFRKYYDERRFLSNEYRPYLAGTLTDMWYHEKKEKIWTPWIVRWAMAKNMYNLYPYIHHLKSLSASYRDSGLNYHKSMGPDHAPITDNAVMSQRLNDKLNSLQDLLRFDYCFNEVPKGRLIDVSNSESISIAASGKPQIVFIVNNKKYLYNQLCICEQVVSRHVEDLCRKDLIFYVGMDEQLAADLAFRGFTAAHNKEGTLAQFIKKIKADGILLVDLDQVVLKINDLSELKFSGNITSGCLSDGSIIYLRQPEAQNSIEKLSNFLNSFKAVAGEFQTITSDNFKLPFLQKVALDNYVIKDHDYGCAFVQCKR